MSILTRIEEWLLGHREPPSEAQCERDKWREAVHRSRNVNFIAQRGNAVTKSASEQALTVAEQAIRRMEQARRDDEERRHVED